MPAEERMLLALLFCSDIPTDILAALKPGWDQLAALPLQEKIRQNGYDLTAAAIFPWIAELSSSIDAEAFALSHLQQPNLFLRLRPGYEKAVQQQLQKAGIPFQLTGNNCIALPNGSKIDELVQLNRQAVVQDYNSQQTGTVLQQSLDRVPISAWDCCAASGGKSIMVHDIYPDVNLVVSDIRQSILTNLDKRFKEAGIRNYHSFVADLSQSGAIIPAMDADIIIADVPCSGSGTWSRTPEQLYYFDAAKIDHYSSLQQRILQQVMPRIKKGGYLFYITCSVFEKENELQVQFIQAQSSFELINMQVLKGYDKNADTLFAAVLRKGE